jgi:hypothetical protein
MMRKITRAIAPLALCAPLLCLARDSAPPRPLSPAPQTALSGCRENVRYYVEVRDITHKQNELIETYDAWCVVLKGRFYHVFAAQAKLLSVIPENVPEEDGYFDHIMLPVAQTKVYER